ncbi:MAG: methyltransferase domain-containing protein [Nitrospirae bacterium]|nr:methyltransferase domain-containing protein [Nitrospirota bacterium]
MDYHQLQFVAHTLMEIVGRMRGEAGRDAATWLLHGGGVTGLVAHAALSLLPGTRKVLWSDNFPESSLVRRMGFDVRHPEEHELTAVEAAVVTTAPSVAQQVLPGLRRHLPPHVRAFSLMKVEEMTGGLSVDVPESDGRTEVSLILPLVVASVLRYTFAAERVEGRVLDIGCGTGYGSRILSTSATRVTGADRDPVALAAARQYFSGPSVKFERRDLRSFRRPFDCVVSFETLEHQPDFEAATRHLAALARRAFVFSVPYKEAPGTYHFHERFDLDESVFTSILGPVEFHYQTSQGLIAPEKTLDVRTLIGVVRKGAPGQAPRSPRAGRGSRRTAGRPPRRGA